MGQLACMQTLPLPSLKLGDKLKEEIEKELDTEIEIKHTRWLHLSQFINTPQLMEWTCFWMSGTQHSKTFQLLMSLSSYIKHLSINTVIWFHYKLAMCPLCCCVCLHISNHLTFPKYMCTYKVKIRMTIFKGWICIRCPSVKTRQINKKQMGKYSKWMIMVRPFEAGLLPSPVSLFAQRNC